MKEYSVCMDGKVQCLHKMCISPNPIRNFESSCRTKTTKYMCGGRGHFCPYQPQYNAGRGKYQWNTMGILDTDTLSVCMCVNLMYNRGGIIN